MYGVPFFGQRGFLCSPTRDFTLPPAATAMAEFQAQLVLPQQCRWRVINGADRIFIDEEAHDSSSKL